MVKNRGMNYRTKKNLMIASLVLKSVFFALIVAAFFTIVKNLELLQALFDVLYKIALPETDLSVDDLNHIFSYVYIMLTVFTIIVATLIAYNVFIMLKTKEQFYESPKQIAIFQFVSCLSLFFTPISAILMIVASFWQDDNKPTKIKNKLKTNKPKKVKVPKDIKKQINALKREKRAGKISKELYDKKVKKLMKSMTQNK